MWGVDEAELDKLKLAATTAGVASPHKATSGKATTSRKSLVDEGEASPSRRDESLAQSASRRKPEVVLTKDAHKTKRKRPETDERLVLKIARTKSLPTVVAMGRLPSDPAGQVVARPPLHEGSPRDQRQVEELEAEVDDLRHQLREMHRKHGEELEQRVLAEQKVAMLQQQQSDLRDEVGRLRHALTVASEQGSRRELEARLVQLERRVERE